MKTNVVLLIILVIAIFSSCNRTEEVIASQFPNGTTQLLQEFDIADGKRDLIKETRFYPNGQKEIEYELKNHMRNGKLTQWYATGEKWMEEMYVDNIKDGEFSIYYPNGKVNYTGFYIDGKPSGKWIFYDETGSMVSEKQY